MNPLFYTSPNIEYKTNPVLFVSASPKNNHRKIYYYMYECYYVSVFEGRKNENVFVCVLNVKEIGCLF